jgi:hypothetical protein
MRGDAMVVVRMRSASRAEVLALMRFLMGHGYAVAVQGRSDCVEVTFCGEVES